MSKTFHRKWFDDYGNAKRRKFKDRRNKRKKSYENKHQVIERNEDKKIYANIQN